MQPAKSIVQNLLNYADIQINGHVPGICKCMTIVFLTAPSGKAPLVLGRPIWTVGGMLRNLMNFLPASFRQT